MNSLESLELQLLDGIQAALASPTMDAVMVAVTRLGGGVIWVLLGITLLFFKRYRPNGFAILGALAISALLTEFAVKLIFLRERPFEVNVNYTLLISPPFGTSFPSGHTATSFASAVQLFGINKRCGVIACCFAAIVAFSRLYLYVHFPSDVLIGAILGTGIGVGFAKICTIVRNKKQKE